MKLATFDAIQELHLKVIEEFKKFNLYRVKFLDRYWFSQLLVAGLGSMSLWFFYLDNFMGFFSSMGLFFIIFFMTLKFEPTIQEDWYLYPLFMKKGAALQKNIQQAKQALHEYLAHPENMALLMQDIQKLKASVGIKEKEELDKNERLMKQYFVQGDFEKIEDCLCTYYCYYNVIKDTVNHCDEHMDTDFDAQFNAMVYGEKTMSIGQSVSPDETEIKHYL